MAETSRRIAWPTVTMDSRASPSGSERRRATSAIDCDNARISRERWIICATAKKKPIGPKNVRTSASSVGAKLCCNCDRYGDVRMIAKTAQTTDKMPAAMKSGFADGTRVDCKICPTDFQSSFAAGPGSISAGLSAMINSSRTSGAGSRTGRRTSGAGLRTSSRAGGGGAAGAGRAATELVISASLTFSAS